MFWQTTVGLTAGLSIDSKAVELTRTSRTSVTSYRYPPSRRRIMKISAIQYPAIHEITCAKYLRTKRSNIIELRKRMAIDGMTAGKAVAEVKLMEMDSNFHEWQSRQIQGALCVQVFDKLDKTKTGVLSAGQMFDLKSLKLQKPLPAGLIWHAISIMDKVAMGQSNCMVSCCNPECPKPLADDML